MSALLDGPREPHDHCSVWGPCHDLDAVMPCPYDLPRQRRAVATQAGAWRPLVPDRDRYVIHSLDGRPVHCGDTIELQSVEIKSDDYGEYRVPVDHGTLVRYECDFLREPPTATLHLVVGGWHVFVTYVRDDMRFRWPAPRRESA